MDYINDLYEIYDTLGKSLKDANEKIQAAGGKLSASDMDYVDQITHAIKSVKTTIAMLEAEENGGSYRRDGYSREDRGYHEGNSYDDGGSYARGRGRNAKRDSMGRYSNRGYHGDMVDELRELMGHAPDEQTRQEMQRLIQRLER